MGLAEDARGLILDNYHGARDHMEYIIRLKTYFWGVLPWVLAGLAHCDVVAARSHALLVVLPLLVAAAEIPEAHHRLTRFFLDPVVLAQLERWANGIGDLWAYDELLMLVHHIIIYNAWPKGNPNCRQVPHI